MSAAAELVAPKPRRQRKETQQRIDAARREGYEMGRRDAEGDGSMTMLALVLWSMACLGVGAAGAVLWLV